VHRVRGVRVRLPGGGSSGGLCDGGGGIAIIGKPDIAAEIGTAGKQGDTSMNVSRICGSLLIAGALLMAACSTDRADGGPDEASSYLPKKIDALAQSGEIRVYRGDSLWAYIDGGAEVYYPYGFIEVATGDYKSEATELVIDIYRFETPLGAFGLYSMFRSADSKATELGVDGSITPGQVSLVKGVWVVRLTGFDDGEATMRALQVSAREISRLLPGTTELPREFASLPDSAAVARSERFHAGAFLRVYFLTRVFTRDFVLAGDTVTMFVSFDEAGQKVLEWGKLAEVEKSILPAPADLPYDDGKMFVTAKPQYGTIIVGMKNGVMAGMVGYRDSARPFLIAWLESISPT
jgi:hypothetical protein